MLTVFVMYYLVFGGIYSGHSNEFVLYFLLYFLGIIWCLSGISCCFFSYSVVFSVVLGIWYFLYFLHIWYFGGNYSLVLAWYCL